MTNQEIMQMVKGDCTPAHALMELVRAKKLTHNAAWAAYQERYGVDCGMGLVGMEKAELHYMQRMDI